MQLDIFYYSLTQHYQNLIIYLYVFSIFSLFCILLASNYENNYIYLFWFTFATITKNYMNR